MEYGRIIKRALAITWNHKVLWIFGIAAAFFGVRGGGGGNGGQGISYSLNGGDMARWQRNMPWRPGPPFFPRGMPPARFFDLQSLLPLLLGVAVLVLLFALVMFVVSLIVRYTSLGALVGMVDEVEETERTSFRSGFNRGWGRMLRLLAIDLLIGVATFLVLLPFILIIVMGAMIVVGPAVALFASGGGAVALGIVWIVGTGLVWLLFIILGALAMTLVTTLVREFAFRVCVIEQKGVFDALGMAFKLIRARAREAMLMWLLLLGINLAVSLAAIPVALLGVGGLLGPAFLVFQVSRSVPAAILTALPFLLVIIVVGTALAGIYLTFRSTVWTLTYRELRGKQMLEAAV